MSHLSIPATKNPNCYKIRPENIIIDESVNGRKFAHDESAVAVLCNSFKEQGQQQPVMTRLQPGGKTQLVLGYRRWKAALLYNQLYPDTPMELDCMLVVCNDEEALQRNIVENNEQMKTTPVDDAHNQRTLREKYGWTDTRIGQFYHQPQSYVSLLKKVPMLPESEQLLMKDGTRSLQAALATLDPLVSNEERATLQVAVPVDGAPVPATNTPLTNEEVIKRVREIKQNKGGRQPRTVTDVKKYLAKVSEEETGATKTFADLFLKFVKGYYADKTMTVKLKELLEDADALAPLTEPAQETAA